MKRVLIIAYHFPPENLIGTLRPMGLAKYLPLFGWEPIILTTQLQDSARDVMKRQMNIFEIPPFDITTTLRRFIRVSEQQKVSNIDSLTSLPGNSATKIFVKHLLKTVFAFPDKNNGWYLRAINAADKIIAEEQIDCILSTSSPWTVALIARKLKTRHNIPWLADFRDLWTQNHRYDYFFPRIYLERYLERWTLGKADVMVMVSEVRAKKWERLHWGKKIVPITLGYDPDDFCRENTGKRRDKLLITHAGKVKGKQNPEPLFRVVSELISEKQIPNDRIEIRFWGLITEEVRHFIKAYCLEDIVKLFPEIPRREVIKKELESHLLLVLTWNDPMEPGIHPGKLFDYLGARVPILAIGEYPDVVTSVLKRTKAGIHIIEYDKLKSYLIEAYSSFEKNGELPFGGNENEIVKFTYQNIAGQFAELLNSISRTK
jgi:glycosyltransferase involved in cell wall biosynthesis